MVISGIFILKGQEWARITLMIWVLGVLIITFLVAGLTFQVYTKSIVAISIFLLLYQSEANKYFPALEGPYARRFVLVQQGH